MNLADPELELIDPTPNIHNLFIHFDKIFFWTKLASRVVVRWSKRMYSCAGVCSYEGVGGLCNIALSEPLLKLRPRKDLVETLLHEMIHAYLFVAVRDRDRDGHGPNFQAHMHRINKCAGLNISIYHDFHDEVKLYLTHWWRCNGPCQKRRPHFGIVRRSANRAPGPSDFWWNDHKRQCGGTFIKIKEPEQRKKLEKQGKKNNVVKPTADITKYINNKTPSTKSILKDSNTIPVKTAIKSNSSSTVVVTQKGIKNGVTSSQQSNKPPPVLFSGKGQTVSGVRERSNSVGVVETVRNIWANKQFPEYVRNKQIAANRNEPERYSAVVRTNILNTNKHKAKSVHADSPPSKVKKIDDYFKTAATVLKDVYGQDFNITQSRNDKKLVATVATETVLVVCPVCQAKVKSTEVNRHLDECLSKEIIDNLSNDANVNNSQTPKTPNPNLNSLKQIVGFLPPIPAFNQLSSVIIKPENTIIPQSIVTHPDVEFDSNDVNRVKLIAKKITYDKIVRKSDNFIVPKDEKISDVDFGYLPSFLDDIACKIETPPIKIEPGTSKDIISELDRQKCACCGKRVDKPIQEHLDECLSFFDNDTTIPEEGASTSFINETIVIDDDDIFDETLTLNATGTKLPCPCCLKMTEEANMNDHLDKCLG